MFGVFFFTWQTANIVWGFDFYFRLQKGIPEMLERRMNKKPTGVGWGILSWLEDDSISLQIWRFCLALE